MTSSLYSQQQILVDAGGQGDFSTIQSAFESINGTTLSSDVEILIRAGEYDESLSLDSIDNTASDHHITIRSESGNPDDVIITNTDNLAFDDRILFLREVDHVTVAYLTFQTSTDVSESFVGLNGIIDDITFDQNAFANETDNVAYAIFDSYNFQGQPDTITNLVITNNRFSDVFAFYSIWQEFRQLVFEDNVLEDLVPDYSGDQNTWYHVDGLTITGNDFSGIDLGLFTDCQNVVINRNRIVSDDGGMVLSSDYSQGHSTYLIYNNFIISENFGMNILTGGLEVDVLNNNFYMKGGGSAGSIQLSTNIISNITNRISVYNNIFYGEDPDVYGVVIVHHPDSVENLTVDFDYNNYHLSEADHEWYLLSAEVNNYNLSQVRSELGMEANGLSLDPLYQSELDLHIGNVGLKDKGKAIDYITVDYDGETREGLPDIGADELQGFVSLAPVDSLEITGVLKGGKNITLKYTAENQGNLRLGGEWQDAIYLSSDDVLDASDRRLFEINRSLLLEPGESYQGDVALTLPIDIEGGTYYLLLRVNDEELEFDNDLSDNTLASESLSFMELQLPDLEITGVNTPPTQFSGKSFELSWTVTNNGTGPTPDIWQDYIFVANDSNSLLDPSILDSDSLFLRRVAAPVALNEGESYQQSVTVSIPLRYSGKLYYRIQADGGGNITESDATFGANGLNSQVINITQSPLPDLAVTQLNSPATAFSGEKVPVNWTVENVGQQSTYRTAIQLDERDWLDRSNYNYWYDHVYISKKPVYDPDEITQRVVARYDRGDDELDAGQSYTVNDSIDFLSCEYGWYYVLVRANDDQYTYELTRQNNINLLDSIELIIDPMPDMLPTQLSISSDSAFSGRPLEISYEIQNVGFSNKPESRNMDYFYISRLDSLVEEESTFIGFESVTDPLDKDASYSRTVSFTLPYDEFGDYHLFIKTDSENNICEVQGEDNNVLGIPLDIHLADQPDLVPGISAIADTLYAGGSYSLTYSVRNEGQADALEDSWFDEIIIGTKRVHKKEYSDVLAPGGSYVREVHFTVDLDHEEGPESLHLSTDINDDLFEFGGEDNNMVTNQVYISRDPGNVPDLSLDNLQIANSGLTAGDTLVINYTVLNNAAGTPRNGWTDRIRLIDPAGEVVWYEDLKHLGNIPAGSSFEGTHEVQLPYTLKGDYNVELILNNRSTLIEYNTENNKDHVPTSIMAYMPPDLEVGAVDYASCCNLFALQEGNVTIDIRNNGPGALDLRSFTLKVKLSEDQAGSNASTLIAHRQGFLIDSGGSTSVSLPVLFDAHLSGDYFTVVELDTEEEIYEGKFKFNNRYVTGYTVNIDNEPVLLYPSDLTINSEVAPDFNRSLRLSYVVEKGTGNPLRRYIEDQVIISADKIFDEKDYRFTTFQPVYRNLSADSASYVDTLYAYLPAYLPPDWYYVGVKADAKNNVLELDETNNVLFTADSFYLDFTVPLELDLPETLWFYEGTVGGQEAFSLSRPADKGMIVSVDFSDDQASSELFHRVGKMPTRSDFDNRYRDPFLADQEVIVPVTDTATTDYLRLFANRVPWVYNSPLDFDCWSDFSYSSGGNVIGILDLSCELPDTVPYTIHAKGAEYSIIRTVPDSASYLGVSNILIEGFDFEESMQFYLVRGNDSIAARRVEILSSTEAMAVFDCRDQAGGIYDMLAVKQTGESTLLEDHFTLFEGSPPVPWASVNHSVRRQLVSRKFYVNVDFGNYAHMNGYDYWFIVAFATASGSLDHISSDYIGSSVEEIYDQLDLNLNPTGDSNYVDIDGIRYYVYWIPVLPPRSQTTFSYIIDSKTEDLLLTQAIIYEQPLSRFQLEQDIEYIGQSVTVAKLLEAAFDSRVNAKDLPLKTGGVKSGSFDCNDIDVRAVEVQIAKDVKSVAENIHGGAKAYKGASNLGEAVEIAIKNKKEAYTDIAKNAADIPGNFVDANKDLAKKQFVSMVKKEKGPISSVTDWATEVFNAVDPVTQVQESLEPEELPFEDLINNTFSCLDPEQVKTEFEKCYMRVRDDLNNTYKYVRLSKPDCNPPGGGGGGGSFITEIVESFDPNAIIGPEGVTDARLINREDQLKYTIMFENKAEASAPARFVAIDNDLPGGLRPQSLVLTAIGFGDTTIQFDPTNRLNIRIPLGKKYNHQHLDVVAGIDIVNNRVFWRFSTIDPETGNLTMDPFNGFLPPNDSTGIGEGFVNYEIRLDPAVQAGSEINNQAEIRFDQNEVIPTNVWSNLVATSDPVSQVNELPETSAGNFTVSWEGNAGLQSAGLLGYDIYVSRDDRPYELLLESTLATSTIFSGVHGATYRFYSVLKSLDGTVEQTPATADAVTVVDTTQGDTTQVGLEELLKDRPGASFLSKVYPIPANDRLWIDYAARDEVHLKLFDLNGRLLHEKMLPPSFRGSTVQIDMRPFPDGVLILHLHDQDTREIVRIVHYKE